MFAAAILTLSLYSPIGALDADEPRPKALLALESYRRTHMSKGKVEWSRYLRHKGKPAVRHYTCRFAGDQHWFTNRGDDEGVVGVFAPDNSPVKGRADILMLEDGTRWRSDGRSLMAKVYPAERNRTDSAIMTDIRAMDVSVQFESFRDLHSALWRSGLEKKGRIQYRESREGELHVVVASCRNADNRRIEHAWWLDPRRGWCAVRSEYRVDGKVVKHTRAKRRKFGDVWLPEEIEFFWEEVADKPFQRIKVHSARFDDALPDSFAPADIGVETGTNVIVQPTSTQPARMLSWAGEKGIDKDEFSRKLTAGELKRGPNFMRNLQKRDPRVKFEDVIIASRKASGPAPGTAAHAQQIFDDKWDRYLKDFIKTHGLSTTQTEAANSILSDCRRLAEGHFAVHKREIEAFFKRIAKPKGTDPNSIQKDRARLIGPIDDLFEKRLKPRLNGLLTSEQRRRMLEATGQSAAGG